MIEISQLKLPCGTDSSALEKKIRNVLRLAKTEPVKYKIVRHSVDARKKPELMDVYTVRVDLGNKKREEKLVSRMKNANVSIREPAVYSFPVPGKDARFLESRPIVVGSGPAGLFAALELARHGYQPIVLERGECMEQRTETVEHFFRTGELDPESNIQFGEGGAGTFSDGKLTTNVKDKAGRNQYVVQKFIECGATEDIAYENLPHIGTDVLRTVIKNLRNEIIALGGEVRFRSKVTELISDGGHIAGVKVVGTDPGQPGSREEILPCQVLVLAPGHSARDLIRTLHREQVPMRQKNFAVGFRLSHPQEMINHQQYGISDREEMERLHLPAVSYKLTGRGKTGRGVYSFCMCPGGYVVNASSEPGRLAVNGMSDYARDSARANSAIVMSVDGSDFGSEDVLAGLYFQEKLEERAYRMAEGRVPVEAFSDFETRALEQGDIRWLSEEEADAMCIKGLASYAPLHTLLPWDLTEDFIEGMHSFESKIPGYTGPEAYVIGLESRTSSPVRIERNESLESSLRGLYPCGEGAGYAGGIMSAAIDGLKVAEAIGRAWRRN